MKPRLFIVDASYHIYRVWYAIQAKTPVKGHPNVLHGFLGFLRNLFENHRAEHISIVFDPEGGKQTERQEMYPEYKANRDPCPPEVLEQRELVKEACWLLGLSVWEEDGVEADDIIATLAWSAVSSGATFTIVGNDKDFYQCLAYEESSEILQYKGGRKKVVVAPKDVKKRELGVEPHQVSSFLALVGDKADNIPGLEGCGPANAKKILDGFADLDQALGAILARGKEKRTKIEQKLVDDWKLVQKWWGLVVLDERESTTDKDFGSIDNEKPHPFEDGLPAFIKEHDLHWIRDALLDNPHANTVSDIWTPKV